VKSHVDRYYACSRGYVKSLANWLFAVKYIHFCKNILAITFHLMDSLNLYLYLYYKEAKELKNMMYLDNLYPPNI